VIEIPAGSRLTAEISVGAVRTSGHLGATRIKNSTGSVDLDTTGDLWLRLGHGSATVEKSTGSAEITADHGQIRLGEVDGDALLKASHGSISVGTSGGDVEAKLSYGDLTIGTALGGVSAKTAYGTIRIDSVSGGAIDVESGYGAVTVGVSDGVAAWLDLSSRDGRVRNDLANDTAPAPDAQSVAVRARTRFGNITVERARAGGCNGGSEHLGCGRSHETSDGVRVLERCRVVVPGLDYTVNKNRASTSVALIEIFVSRKLTVLVAFNNDRVTVDRPPDNRRWASRIHYQARRHLMVVIVARPLRVALTHILSLVRDGIVATGVHTTEEHHAVEQHTYRPHRETRGHQRVRRV
jgi:hypothetical protein